MDVWDNVGIKLSESFINSFIVQNNGYMNLTFGEKDYWNHFDKARQLWLSEGGVKVRQNYLFQCNKRTFDFIILETKVVMPKNILEMW